MATETNDKPSRKDLHKAANNLLAQAGFSNDGTPKEEYSTQQRRFETKRILRTPMGNSMR
jgi:hypothetical protein